MSAGTRGLVYRLTIKATSPDLETRLSCTETVRSALRSVAVDWGIDGEALADLLTVGYELVVNAVKHTPPGWLQAVLHLSPDGDRVIVEVHDLSRRLPHVASDALANEVQESGRGLLMVGGLSVRWGVAATAGGKRVWAELALPAPVPVPVLTRQARRAYVIADVVRASRLRAAMPSLRAA
ncbi:ATP-binding protein [Kitasatospora indigofera]|uniref:ATP-binding protein n=1 Tax=Kitasatospora indigofera TaxID=67307 RepID=UPI0033BB0D67